MRSVDVGYMYVSEMWDSYDCVCLYVCRWKFQCPVWGPGDSGIFNPKYATAELE